MSIQKFSSNLENSRLLCTVDARKKINARRTKVSKSLYFFCPFLPYILLRARDAKKEYFYFSGHAILSGYFKNFISLTVSRTARRIADQRKEEDIDIKVTALEHFKQTRGEFTFVEKKNISWLNFLYVSSVCNFLNSSLILGLEESDE